MIDGTGPKDEPIQPIPWQITRILCRSTELANLVDWMRFSFGWNHWPDVVLKLHSVDLISDRDAELLLELCASGGLIKPYDTDAPEDDQ